MNMQSDVIQIGDSIIHPYSVDPSILRIARHGKKQWEMSDGSVSSVENAVLDRFKDAGYSGYFTGQYDLKRLLVTLAAWAKPFDEFNKYSYAFNADEIHFVCAEGHAGSNQHYKYHDIINNIHSFNEEKLQKRFYDLFKLRPGYSIQYNCDQHADFIDIEKHLRGLYKHFNNKRILHEIEEKCPYSHVINQRNAIDFFDNHFFKDLANIRGYSTKNNPITDYAEKYIEQMQPKIDIDLKNSTYKALTEQQFVDDYVSYFIQFPGDYWSKRSQECEELLIHNQNFVRKIKDENIREEYVLGVQFIEKTFQFIRETKKKTELDICIWNDNEYYEIEVKAPNDRLRKNQRHTIIENNENGIVSFMVNVIEG